MSNDIFHSYDIRGIYPDQVNEDFAYQLGRALVICENATEVAVGHDARLSSDNLSQQLIQGIIDQGANVIDLGLVSTDIVSWAVAHYGYDAGLMITASHNPAQYNGFKICRAQAVTITLETGLDKIRQQIKTGDLPAVANPGTITTKDTLADWIDHLLTFIDDKKIKPLRIVVDASNGSIGPIITALFTQLPQLELIPLYFEPDGHFPNHSASPLDPDSLRDLRAEVLSQQADLGVIFDGDGDRVLLMDSTGQILDGSTTTAILAKDILAKHPGETVLYNSICGQIVPEIITKHGGTAIRTPVGFGFIRQQMSETNAIFAGEHSGHYFFRDNSGIDSGILAMLILLELISQSGQPLVEFRKQYEPYFASEEINFTVDSIPDSLDRISQELSKFKQDRLDGLSIYGSEPEKQDDWSETMSKSEGRVEWWANIRGSNNEPLLRLNVEADTPELLQEKVELITKLITS